MKIDDLKKYGIDGPNEGKLIIDLSSEWCGPCKLLTPVLEQFKEEGLINLIHIDIDNNRELGQAMNISAVPTLMFFKDGKLLEKNIEIYGRVVVHNGIMAGTAGDLILKEIINQM
ncbi:MAG: thioredoxin family protein [Promethearchaeota archaeon]